MLKFATLIILGLAGNVNAASKPNEFQQFVSNLIEKGEEVDYDLYNEELDVPSKAIGHTQTYPAARCADGLSRTVTVIVGKKKQPEAIILISRRTTPTESIADFVKLTPKGKPKLLLSQFQRNQGGKPIKGSLQFKKEKTNSDGAKALLQRELDFWLHGKGLK